VSFAGVILTSNDSGVTWQTNNAPENQFWQAAASSAGGAQLVIVPSGGRVYVSKPFTPVPTLAIRSLPGSVAVSWLTNAGGYGLQWKDQFNANSWVNLPLTFDKRKLWFLSVEHLGIA
jgi:hypothetical protein